jgi:hypothetical protein
MFCSAHLRIEFKYILVYIQQDITLHSLFYLETHHQERKQLYLQNLVFVTPLRLPVAIAAGSSTSDDSSSDRSYIVYFTVPFFH